MPWEKQSQGPTVRFWLEEFTKSKFFQQHWAFWSRHMKGAGLSSQRRGLELTGAVHEFGQGLLEWGTDRAICPERCAVHIPHPSSGQQFPPTVIWPGMRCPAAPVAPRGTLPVPEAQAWVLSVQPQDEGFVSGTETWSISSPDGNNSVGSKKLCKDPHVPTAVMPPPVRRKLLYQQQPPQGSLCPEAGLGLCQTPLQSYFAPGAWSRIASSATTTQAGNVHSDRLHNVGRVEY